MGCQRPSRFWGLGCPKIYHEAEDTLAFLFRGGGLAGFDELAPRMIPAANAGQIMIQCIECSTKGPDLLVLIENYERLKFLHWLCFGQGCSCSNHLNEENHLSRYLLCHQQLHSWVRCFVCDMLINCVRWKDWRMQPHSCGLFCVTCFNVMLNCLIIGTGSSQSPRWWGWGERRERQDFYAQLILPEQLLHSAVQSVCLLDSQSVC